MFWKRFTPRQWLLLAGLLAMALLLAVTVTRAVGHALHLRQPPADAPLQGWMNVPAIAHNYKVPPPLIAQALGVTPGERRPLDVLAQAQGRSVAELEADVLRAVQAERARRQQERGPPPAPGGSNGP